jgi:hypothetical protein
MIQENGLSRAHLVFLLGAFSFFLALTACGGGEGDGRDGPGSNTLTPVAGSDAPPTGATNGAGTDSSTATGSSPPASTGGSNAGDPEEIDVCGLITQDEVESVIGGPAGPPMFHPVDSAVVFGSVEIGGGDCRFEADDITPVVSITVLAWPDAETAETSFEFGLELDNEIDGLGDQAMSTQPIGDVTVLSGPYEVLFDLFFVNEDDAIELQMARDLAEIVMPRLP